MTFFFHFAQFNQIQCILKPLLCTLNMKHRTHHLVIYQILNFPYEPIVRWNTIADTSLILEHLKKKLYFQMKPLNITFSKQKTSERWSYSFVVAILPSRHNNINSFTFYFRWVISSLCRQCGCCLLFLIPVLVVASMDTCSSWPYRYLSNCSFSNGDQITSTTGIVHLMLVWRKLITREKENK